MSQQVLLNNAIRSLLGGISSAAPRVAAPPPSVALARPRIPPPPVESTALALPRDESGYLKFVEPEALFDHVETDPLRELLEEYGRLREKVETVAAIASGEAYEGVVGYFVRGNCSDDRNRSSVQAERLFRADGAIAALNADFWRRAMDLTDVYQTMPQKRRTEWDNLIGERKTPEFDEQTVRATLGDLLSKRALFFGERVEGVFARLSPEHLTNCPAGFNGRMIFHHMTSYGLVSSEGAGYIYDLRDVMGKFYGMPEQPWGRANQILETANRQSGKWLSVDGGLWRVKTYKKGTAHVEIHPAMAWRLNAILAHLHPRAIAHEHRRRPTQRDRKWGLIQQPLPNAVLEILNSAAAQGYGRRDHHLPYDWNSSKAIGAEVRRVIETLGGTIGKSGDRDRIQFSDFSSWDALDEVIVSGCIPDVQSHQFYPTPSVVGERVIAAAEIEAGDETLEPQAGLGGLADLVPKGARLTCVEVAHIRCIVLRGKGYETVEGDFLEWAKTAPSKFKRIVMNPPFSEGRWKAHLEAAATLLVPGGRLVAVLPDSQRGKALLPLGEFIAPEWSESIKNEFDGTSVAVAIMAVDRLAKP